MIEDVLKIAKTMKRPIVYICPFYMLGTDEEFCTLSKIEINSDIDRPVAFEMSGVLTQATKDKFAEAHPEIYFSEYSQVVQGLFVNTWREKHYMNILLNMWNRISFVDTITPVYSCDELEKDSDFKTKVAKMKVSDGLQKYILNGNYLQTSFNKVHSINATDKVSLDIYDLDYESFMYRYTINKKKYNVVEYIRYRKMF